MEMLTRIGNQIISISLPSSLVQLSNSFSYFQVPSGRIDYRFETKETDTLTVPLAAENRRDHYFKEYNQHEFYVGNDNFSLIINFQDCKAQVTIPSRFGNKNLLVFNAFKWFLSLLTIYNGGIPLHCSAVFINDKALLFSGRSGIGKSTICNILSRTQNWQRGSDELNLIFIQGSDAYGYPTPFLSFDGPVRTAGAQIKHLFFLGQSLNNEIKSTERNKKCWNLLKNVYTIPINDYMAEKMYNNVQEISKIVGCSDLNFINNDSIGKFLEDWINTGYV